MTQYNQNQAYMNAMSSYYASSQNNQIINYQQEPEVEDKEQYLRENMLVIYSGDRSYIDGETTFSYNVLFSPKAQSRLSQRAFFLKSLKNIRSIEIKDVYIPNFYLDVNTIHGLVNDSIITNSEIANSNIIRFPRLSDLPYIVLRIKELGSTLQGTNPVLNQATCMLTLDTYYDKTTNTSGRYEYKTDSTFVSVGNNSNSVLSETDKRVLRFKNNNKIQKIYYPTPQSKLGDLQIEFFDHLGVPLQFQTDYLSLQSVDITGGNKLKLTFSTFFSPEEFGVGDLINIRNARVTNGTNLSLEQYLNKKEGHVIIGVDDASVSNTSLFQSIHIAFPYTINLSTGLTTKNTLNVSGTITMNQGTLINQSLQHSITLLVNTEEYNYGSQVADLI
jgi:hypothetical protein